MLATVDELAEAISLKFGVSYGVLSADSFSAAANASIQELGWDLPTDHNLKDYWLAERGVRHAIFILMLENAKNFKYKQISLNQKFENYKSILEYLDKAFLEAKENNPELFSCSVFFDEAAIAGFISYIPNLPDYDFLGRKI